MSIIQFWFIGGKNKIVSSIVILFTAAIAIYFRVLNGAAVIAIHFRHLPQTGSNGFLIVIKYLVYLINYFLFEFEFLCKSVSSIAVQ